MLKRVIGGIGVGLVFLAQGMPPASAIATDIRVTIEAIDLTPAACSGTFVTHDLRYTTTTSSDVIGFYESNGTGLAINDLDDDGRLDIVLANLYGRNTILWNDGDLNFTPQPLADRQSRAAAIVDVDGDGLLDIVFSHVAASLDIWRNLGDRTFHQETLPGVRKPAFTFTWSDVDHDGDLDLATGSYNVELAQKLGSNSLFNQDAGIIYYENQAGEFNPTRLSDESQALAIWMGDLNADGHAELIIGNDFLVPDQLWTYGVAEWRENRMFETTTYSTMSFDVGDVDNNRRQDIFAADMKPYQPTPAVMAIWQPVFDAMRQTLLPDNPQHMENVLQMALPGGNFSNYAAGYGVTASGWSWSGKFGDLDQDGYLDLYVVNGMIARELFPTQLGKELIEENQAFHNLNGERFVPAPEWGLGSTRSGRGMSMADLDNDGDLDIVVNNLTTPAQLFENQLCQGSSLQVELYRKDVPNTCDLGAVLHLYTDHGTYTRDIRALSGYLSGDPARVHFGFPLNTELQALEIVWSDGSQNTITDLTANQLLKIRR
jgi:hypothetical protein